jgi:hypothetical protein
MIITGNDRCCLQRAQFMPSIVFLAINLYTNNRVFMIIYGEKSGKPANPVSDGLKK